MNVNVNLMVKNVIQIKSRITINVGASPNSKKKKKKKKIVCMKKIIIFGVLLQTFTYIFINYYSIIHSC